MRAQPPNAREFPRFEERGHNYGHYLSATNKKKQTSQFLTQQRVNTAHNHPAAYLKIMHQVSATTDATTTQCVYGKVC